MFVTMIMPGLICVQVLTPHHNSDKKFIKSVPEHLRTRNTSEMQKLGSIICTHWLVYKKCVGYNAGRYRLLFVAVIKKNGTFQSPSNISIPLPLILHNTERKQTMGCSVQTKYRSQ